MRNRALFIINGSVILVVMAFLFSRFPSVTGVAQEGSGLPGPASDVYPATHLAFVTYGETGMNGVTATTVSQALDENGQIQSASLPQPLFSQPEPSLCQTDAAYAAPNRPYLILQYNCEAALFIHLLDLIDTASQPSVFSRGYFLDWSLDGGWFLFRDIDAGQILLIPTNGAGQQPLDLPFGTYGAAFAPDGETIVYVASKGLGFGSEIGTLDLTGGSAITQHQFPRQIVAYPRWSPDGRQLAYILMPDSNIPYTIGALWLADTIGKPVTLLDETVDAGHGYAPVWSPDGQTIAYIGRENPDSVAANHLPAALQSNIYQVNVASGRVTPLTHFDASLVYGIAWSPDGRWLAFTANDAIWMLEPGAAPVRVSQPGVARHPVWLALP